MTNYKIIQCRICGEMERERLVGDPSCCYKCNLKADPLFKLIKTTEEINGMKKRGEVTDPSFKSFKEPKPVYKLIAKRNILLKKKFESYLEAKEFAIKNTSNHPEVYWKDVYSVIKIK